MTETKKNPWASFLEEPVATKDVFEERLTYHPHIRVGEEVSSYQKGILDSGSFVEIMNMAFADASLKTRFTTSTPAKKILTEILVAKDALLKVLPRDTKDTLLNSTWGIVKKTGQKEGVWNFSPFQRGLLGLSSSEQPVTRADILCEAVKAKYPPPPKCKVSVRTPLVGSKVQPELSPN